MGRNFLGPTADGMLAAGWMPSGVKDQPLDIVGKVERGERVGNFETRRIRKDGSVVDVSLTVSPIRDAVRDADRDVQSSPVTSASARGTTTGVSPRSVAGCAPPRSIGHVGSWEMDLDDQAVVCSRRC